MTPAEERVVAAARRLDAAEPCCDMALFALSEHDVTCSRWLLRAALADLDAPPIHGYSDEEIAARKADGIGGGAPRGKERA